MRYSLVLATLAVSAIATPYINVEVSEPETAAVEVSNNRNNNNNNRHHRVNHGHRDNRNNRNRRNRSWLSTLWGGKDDDEDTEERRGRRDRNGRRNNDRNRRGGRRNRRNGDRAEDDDEYDPANLIDDLFGSDYECVIQARNTGDEKEGARECCREIGGELYDVRGRCIFRDNMENPREDWRSCALEQRGANFAECYYREQREVDDELDDESRHRAEMSRDRNNRRGGRNNRGRRNGDRRNGDRRNGDRRNGDRRNGDRRNRDQNVLTIEDNRDHRHRRDGGRDNDRDNDRDNERFECRVDIDDENRQREITQQCCNDQEVRGRLHQNDERCEVRQGRDADRFENCVRDQGGIDGEQVECRRSNDRRDL